jgi:lipopolysaccharide transport system permease protein
VGILSGYLRELHASRSILATWTLREIKIRYVNTSLGFAWLIVYPVCWILLFHVLFTYVLKLPGPGVPYPLFVMAGLAPWFFFSNTVTNSASSLRNNSHLIPKIYFPREIILLGSLLTGLLDFTVYLILLSVLLVFWQIPVGAPMLLSPLLVVLFATLILGVSLGIARLALFRREVQLLIPLALQFLMYCVPVFYSPDLVPPQFRYLYLLNPLAALMDAFRRVLIYNSWPDWRSLGIAAAVSVSILVFAYLDFKNVESDFADRL